MSSDERGLPVTLAFTQGTSIRQDCCVGPLVGLPTASVVIADPAYDWQDLIDLVRERPGSHPANSSTPARVTVAIVSARLCIRIYECTT